MTYLALSILLLCLSVGHISGHGRLMDPANRSSLWRVNTAALPNYNDDQINCGGKGVQYQTLMGKCGVCGDQFDSPHPQDNENTGKYGKGILGGEYTAGSVIDVTLVLTRNHMGFFNFSLCPLQNLNAPESGEQCFIPLKFGDGADKYLLANPTEEDNDTINLKVKLPDGLTCERCTLRWTYTAGNDWGQCADATYAIGCGAQETFRSCSDIAIH